MLSVLASCAKIRVDIEPSEPHKIFHFKVLKKIVSNENNFESDTIVEQAILKPSSYSSKEEKSSKQYCSTTAWRKS